VLSLFIATKNFEFVTVFIFNGVIDDVRVELKICWADEVWLVMVFLYLWMDDSIKGGFISDRAQPLGG